MTFQLSQVDLNSDGTDPEYFVQIRLSFGEVPEGSVEFYDSSNTNTATYANSFTIDLSSVAPLNSFSAGGYDYYTFSIPGDLLLGNDKNFAIALVGRSGAVESVLMFGTNVAPAGVNLSGGSLDGETAQSVIDTGVVEGGAFQSGTGPFAISDSGAVTTGPSSPNAACFATGTLISTPGGTRAIDDLRQGDLVLTAEGEAVPVLWVGHFTAHKFHSMDSRNAPVRICAHALGDGVPFRDLVLTGDHALHLDGLLVNASVLTNGTSIAYVPLAQLLGGLTFFHVETERHEIILANGCPAETYLDAADRTGFDNVGESHTIFGARRIIPSMAFPRIASRRLLPVSLKARLMPESECLSETWDFQEEDSWAS